MHVEHLKTAEKSNGETIHFGTDNEVLLLKGNDKALLIRALLVLRKAEIKNCEDTDFSPQAVFDLYTVTKLLDSFEGGPQGG